ncbi:MAG: hypothetical protein ACJ0QU_03625 [Halobacteriales archaeon]
MPNSSTLDEIPLDDLIGTCRAIIGDNLRSVTYFTESSHTQIYLRSDLDKDADLAGFTDLESRGLVGAPIAYRGSELGNYLYTIRAFEFGYLLRVLKNNKGVFITTDNITLQDFSEAYLAIKQILA